MFTRKIKKQVIPITPDVYFCTRCARETEKRCYYCGEKSLIMSGQQVDYLRKLIDKIKEHETTIAHLEFELDEIKSSEDAILDRIDNLILTTQVLELDKEFFVVIKDHNRQVVRARSKSEALVNYIRRNQYFLGNYSYSIIEK